MALEEEQSGAEFFLPALAALHGCTHLGRLDAATMSRLAAGAEAFSLPAGARLVDAGVKPKGVYLLVSGRLGVGACANGRWDAQIAGGTLVGDADWLLGQPHQEAIVALRDSELLLLPAPLMEAAAAQSTSLALALARLSAAHRHRLPALSRDAQRARVFVVLANNDEVDVADLSSRLVNELARSGQAELVWDVRAHTQPAAWFHRLEEMNDYVVYVAHSSETAWSRQCCRQADVILLAARASAECRPWPHCVQAARDRGARLELALLHDDTVTAGAAARWLASFPVDMHHHLLDPHDLERVARLLTHRGVGLVLSGGGARGFAHLGMIRALNEARVPIDFVGGASIGAIIAAGLGKYWSDAEMLVRYRRSFVATNPMNDYTFPWVALTRGRKVSRLLHLEFGETCIEDLRRPFFCISADLTTGLEYEHRMGGLADALRASVAIPGVMPPVWSGEHILVDGAALNNMPVDIMRRHTPGLVIGCDVGAERTHLERRRLHIFQILMYTGLVHGASHAAAQRALADVVLKPPLANVDLLAWRSFDRAIGAGYEYARERLETLTQLPRAAVSPPPRAASSLSRELERRLSLKVAGG